MKNCRPQTFSQLNLLISSLELSTQDLLELEFQIGTTEFHLVATIRTRNF